VTPEESLQSRGLRVCFFASGLCIRANGTDCVRESETVCVCVCVCVFMCLNVFMYIFCVFLDPPP